MAVSVKSLAQNDQITGTSDAATDTVYTATGVDTQIAQATAYNSDASPVLVSVYILPSGVAASTVDPVCVLSVTNAESAPLGDLIGHVIPEDGTLAAFAATTNVIRLTVSGIEYS